MRKVKKFICLPLRAKGMWLEAVFFLGLARFRVARIPFRQWSSKLGEHMAAVPAVELTDAQKEVLELISWAVLSAAHHVPWQAVCLPQAMAVKAMLRRRQIPGVLYLGMRKGDTHAFDAHAWVKVGDTAVSGGEGDEFTSVSHFV